MKGLLKNISEDTPFKKIFFSIDFSFIRSFISGALLGREGFDPVCLSQDLLLTSLEELTPETSCSKTPV